MHSIDMMVSEALEGISPDIRNDRWHVRRRRAELQQCPHIKRMRGAGGDSHPHVPGPKATRFTRFYEFMYSALQHNRYGNRVAEMHKEYGRIIRINPNEVHIHDPEFHLRFGQFPLKKKDPWYYNVGLPGATGLICDERHHRSHRSTLIAHLKPRLEDEVPALLRDKMDCLCNRLREYASTDTAVNLSDAFRSLAWDCLSVILLGSCDDLLLQSDLGHQRLLILRSLLRHAAFLRQFPRLLCLERFLPEWLCRKFSPLVQTRRAIRKSVSDRIRQRKMENGLQCLVQALANGKSPLHLADVVDETVEALLGGTEAIGHALTNIAHHVLKDLPLAARLQNELQEGLFDVNMSPDALRNRFPLLDAIIKEGFRTELGNKYRFPRICETAMVYDGYCIPAGAIVSMSPQMTHADPRIFRDPDTFQPARWLDPDSHELEKYLLNFGHGAHRCLGASLARTVIKYVLARLFSEFRLAPLGCTEPWTQDGSLEIFPPRSAGGLKAIVKINSL
ncbi:cytochrome P450 [Aspergillus californicus]